MEIVASYTTSEDRESWSSLAHHSPYTNIVRQIESDDEEEASESDATPAPRKVVKRRRLERSLPST